MRFTKAQQKVIDTRKKNVLVSAAAGSGKTAVLVERIISMISEGDNPIDIDRLLVVTFTNAAAAEMRGRIGKAIDEKLLKEPGNLHLQKQLSLLQSAQITTIHSFCLNVIRNYFHRIDLDPSFKIAEESEITLMKSDVIADLLERWYEEGTEDFHEFIESYSHSKSDAPVEDLILQLYNFSMSDPWPKSWIEEKKRMFDITSMEEFLNAPWMSELVEYTKSVLGDLLAKNSKAISICNESGGPGAYLPALISDRNQLKQLQTSASYQEYSKLFQAISFDRLSAKREEGVDPLKKEKVKVLREEIKKGIKDLANQYFYQTPEEMLKDMQAVDKVMKVLFELTLEFMEEFAKKKEEKNLIDFNDLEHFALKILVKEEAEDLNAEDKAPTQAALELSEQFEEILIDEYQDSNMVQETILKSISREGLGQPNRFMVGDVKQSIYKFRLAMPEIFMEKYDTYSTEELTAEDEVNHYQRIDLDKNFRSRKTVLEYVNRIFEQIMQKSVGGVIYDDTAALKYGELYEETLINTADPEGDSLQLSEEIKSRLASEVELLLVTEEDLEVEEISVKASDKITSEGASFEGHHNAASKTDASNSDASEVDITSEASAEELEYTKKELEARVIAKKIKELTHPEHGMLVFDRKMNGHRPATYRDIVILLRSMSNWSEVFVNTLIQEGISAYADTGTGYFQTLEIMTVLNMLRIIDNPRQDIPLAGVLYSPMVGLTTTELAMIRVDNRNTCLYGAVKTYISQGTSEDLKVKLIHFMDQLNAFRSMVSYKPIHELIQIVLDQTGYYYYALAMTGGDRRKANIDMLISQAVRFEKGSYSGLFHFIRYIEKLHKYEVDFGEAAVSGEQDNTVRIMSIHKSKGLEFPIVFVAGMSKQFNTQDTRNSIVLHSELGAGPEYINSKLRTKIPTLLKRVIQKKVQVENLGEELRVLYVAMTRAKEKLYLTGYLKSLDILNASSIQEGLAEELAGKFSFFELLSAKSYLDWVLPATINRMGWDPELRNQSLICKQQGMSITVMFKKELLKEEITKQLFQQMDQEELLAINPNTVYDEELREKIKNRFNFIYPYQKEAGIKIKMTVSELKKLGQFIDEDQSINLYHNQSIRTLEESIPATIPGFLRHTEATVSGTDRGTLYHKVLELIDLTKIHSREEFLHELDCIVAEGRIKDTDIAMLKQDYIYNFTNSKVSERMRIAQKDKKLYKEKQFVMGIPAAELMQDMESNELILIQGIIDVFFEEDGELVLLDYKSDLVNNEEQLVRRYKVQLEYYKKALEQMLNKKVKEMIIYSLPLGKEIRIVE